VGATLRFASQSSEVVTKTLAGIQTYPGGGAFYPDLVVGVLDSDVPANISFARILPANWQSYLPSLDRLSGISVLRLNQFEQATTASFSGVANGRFQLNLPLSGTQFFRAVITGDSGKPVFLFINSQPTLLGVLTAGSVGIGTFISNHISEINNLMTALGGGYQLTLVNLSSFPTY
jgi:hypothetical protein